MKNEDIKKLKNELRFSQQTLQTIYNSKTWKMLSLYQKIDKKIESFLLFFHWKNLLSKLILLFIPQLIFQTIQKWYFQLKFPRPSKNIFSPHKPDIFIFSIVSWNHQFQRSHQIATQFAENGYRVFYIENSFKVIPRKNLSADDIGKNLEIKKLAEKIYLVKLISFKPIILYRHKITNKIDLKYLKTSLEVLKKLSHSKKRILKIDYPAWFPLVKKSSDPIIYDCMDAHDGFWTNSQEVLSQEVPLAQKANIVLATSTHLQIKMKKLNKNTYLVRNATDFKHFNRKIRATTEIDNLKGVIIGYIGSIADWFNVTIIHYLAKKRPGYHFILIGLISDRSNLSKLIKLPNVKLTGQKPYELLPAYLQKFNVALIPFIRNKLTLATNPVKMYEYLSQGKPTVATDVPETRRIKNLLYLATSKESYLKQLDMAVKEQNIHLRNMRVEFAKKNTWNYRFDQVVKLFNTLLYPKITIIILNYNGLNYTKSCLESIFAYTYYPNYELIIVDNGSTDGSQTYLLNLPKKEWLKVILNKENKGFAGGSNIGIKQATGKYIVLLNNDTIVTEDWLEKLTNHLQNKKIGLIGPVTNAIGNEAKIDLKYQTIEEMHRKAKLYTEVHRGNSFEIDNLGFFCVTGRKRLFDQVGPLDERFNNGYFEDDDYCLRVKNKGYKLICAEDVFIHHFGQATSKTLQDREWIFSVNKLKFEKKWRRSWLGHRYRN